MTELSPAAQAVIDAVIAASPSLQAANRVHRKSTLIAAAFRAAANHGEMLYDPHEGKVAVVRVDLLQTVADELDPTTTASESDFDG